MSVSVCVRVSVCASTAKPMHGDVRYRLLFSRLQQRRDGSVTCTGTRNAWNGTHTVRVASLLQRAPEGRRSHGSTVTAAATDLQRVKDGLVH